MSEIGVTHHLEDNSYTFHFRSKDFNPNSKLVVTKRVIKPALLGVYRPKGPMLVLTLEEETEARVVGSSRVERVPFVIVDKDVLDVTGGMHARSHKKNR